MPVKGLQLLSLLALGSVFALNGLRQFFVDPLANTTSNLIWFVLQVLPLLLVLPGMLALRARSYLLATLVSMLYFVHGVVLAATAELRVLGLWEAGFAVALLAAALLTARRLDRPPAPPSVNDGRRF